MTAAVVALTLVSACTPRSSSSSAGGATPIKIYTAGPTVAQVRSSLGDDSWWPNAPSFGVRPLDLEATPASVRFTITQRYIRIGSGDTLSVDYTVLTSASAATTVMSNLQTAFGTNAQTTPKVGDQALYTGQKLPTTTALYETDAFVRLGAILVQVTLMQGSGFEDFNQYAKLANLLIGRVKDVLANRLKPHALSSDDEVLLPPPGTDITLVGAATLPVEVIPAMLNLQSPEDTTSTFTGLGVHDFVFGDYALNADLHMEVRAVTFTFASSADASSWIDQFVGKANLDASGVFFQYLDPIKQYVGLFAQGSHGAMLVCKSTLDTEAASRACEQPMVTVISAWQVRLNETS